MWMSCFWFQTYYIESIDTRMIERHILSCIHAASRTNLEGNNMSQSSDEDSFKWPATGSRKMKEKPNLYANSEKDRALEDHSLEGEVEWVDQSSSFEEHDVLEGRSESADQCSPSTPMCEPLSPPGVFSHEQSSVRGGHDAFDGESKACDQCRWNTHVGRNLSSSGMFDRKSWFSQRNEWCRTASKEDFSNEIKNMMNEDPGIHESRKPGNRSLRSYESLTTSAKLMQEEPPAGFDARCRPSNCVEGPRSTVIDRPVPCVRGQRSPRLTKRPHPRMWHLNEKNATSLPVQTSLPVMLYLSL